MRAPDCSPAEQIRSLFRLPDHVADDEIFECIFECLVDGLECQMLSPTRRADEPEAYRGAWLLGETRYEADGPTGKEALLGAALNLIRHAPEAEFLRHNCEPDFAAAS